MSGESAGNRRGGCCHEPNGCGQGDGRIFEPVAPVGTETAGNAVVLSRPISL